VERTLNGLTGCLEHDPNKKIKMLQGVGMLEQVFIVGLMVQ